MKNLIYYSLISSCIVITGCKQHSQGTTSGPRTTASKQLEADTGPGEKIDSYRTKRALFAKHRKGSSSIKLSKKQPVDLKKQYLDYTVPLLLKKIAHESMSYPRWDLYKVDDNLAVDKLKQLGPDILPYVRTHFEQPNLSIKEYRACLSLFTYFTDINALLLMLKAMAQSDNMPLASSAHFHLKALTGLNPQETLTAENKPNLVKSWKALIKNWAPPKDHISPHKRPKVPLGTFKSGVRSGPPADWRKDKP